MLCQVVPAAHLTQLVVHRVAMLPLSFGKFSSVSVVGVVAEAAKAVLH